MNVKLDTVCTKLLKVYNTNRIKKRIDYRTILEIRKLHNNLFHTASVNDIVNAIKFNTCLNTTVSVDDVIAVLGNFLK